MVGNDDERGQFFLSDLTNAFMHTFVGGDHSEGSDNDWTIGIPGVVFKGSKNVIRDRRIGAHEDLFFLSNVRGEEWSRITPEFVKVEYIDTNGAYFRWVRGFEEANDAVYIFFIVDTSNDMKLRCAWCGLDCQHASSPVIWSESYLRLV